MKPHIPEKLPLKSLNWMEFIHLVGKANFELARYEGILQGINNPSLFLSPLATQEAVLSSKIEGTEATLEEVLEYEALPQKGGKKAEDIQEIINYRQAMLYAVNYLRDHLINLNLCRNIHYGLLDSVRGRDKARGEFRKTQNWIGKHGSAIEQATYIPPPPDRLMEFLSNLENYIHADEKDRLVQLAIVHAQFEIIHPFLDGNGRVGRILIPLFLVEKGMLSSPVFYISAYLDEHRDIYYEKLNNITQNNNWEEWIAFFLTAIIEQSKSNTQKAKAILDLYEEMKQEIAQLVRSQFSIRALDTIFESPILSSTVFIKRSGIPKASAMRILHALKERGILATLVEAKGRRPVVMVFGKLIDITK